MAAPLWSSSSLAVPPLLCRWLLMEDRMSLVALSINLGPQGGRLGRLLSIYTSWKRFQIFSWEVQYPTSWTVGTSTSGFSLGWPCQRPWQISLSASFCPNLAACTNIPWRMIGQCSPSTSHSRYLSRNIFASI